MRLPAVLFIRHRVPAGMAAVVLLLQCAGCVPVARSHAKNEPAQAAGNAAGSREIRATGTIQAVRALTILVPQITGAMPQTGNNRITLVRLIPNGSRVSAGDVLAEFDRTAQLDAALEAKAKYEDLAHQVREKAAKNRSDAAKRSTEMAEAEADLAKAAIQLKKGPVLSELERLKNAEKAESASARVTSLRKIDAARRVAEEAALEILRLQMERQKVALDRAERNAAMLIVKAPLAGMVALENIWRGGSVGNAQEGDQLGFGQPLLKVFDPSVMEVRTLIGEPDGVALREGTAATVYLDAYPDAVFEARFHSASPVATAALGSPIRNFAAIFRIDASDPRLLPDLSAAVVLHPGGKQ